MDRHAVADAMLKYTLKWGEYDELVSQYKSPLDALKATASRGVRSGYNHQERLVWSLHKIPGVGVWKARIIAKHVEWATIVKGNFKCGEIAALARHDGKCVGAKAEHAIRWMFAKE